MKFSILVVSLNAGDELIKTVKSALSQTYDDFEIIVKDGGSTDGSVEALRESAGTVLCDLFFDEKNNRGFSLSKNKSERTVPSDFPSRLRIYSEKDSGIYDAMNQALQRATGDYVLYLNCGDYLYDERVLEDVAKEIRSVITCDTALHLTGEDDTADPVLQNAGRGAGDDIGTSCSEAPEASNPPYIFYGDIYDRPSGRAVPSNPKLDEFGLYRNVPCHQACFYERSLITEYPLDTHYSVRADYEQFLRCVYEAGAKLHYMDRVISSYQGGGFSETKENRRISAAEHREITDRYMTPERAAKYRRRLLLTLAPLRAFVARNPVTSGLYNGLKSLVYRGHTEGR